MSSLYLDCCCSCVTGEHLIDIIHLISVPQESNNNNSVGVAVGVSVGLVVLIVIVIIVMVIAFYMYSKKRGYLSFKDRMNYKTVFAVFSIGDMSVTLSF